MRIKASKETLEKLQAADDVLRCEGPAEHDWQAYGERVRQVKSELEAFLNVPLLLDDGVQDASYFAGLCPQDRFLCIRFSNWGNFFTIWDDESLQNPLTADDFEPIIALIQSRGFVHINYNELSALYEGQNEFFNRRNRTHFRDGMQCQERATWWERYFDYL